MGTSNVNLWQHPKGLNFWALPCRFCTDVVSPWVTDHWANYWANYGATREHYQPLRSVFSAGCPTTDRKHWARLKHLYFGAALLKKAKKRLFVCGFINSKIFFTSFALFANWYVTRINAKITCKTGNNCNVCALGVGKQFQGGNNLINENIIQNNKHRHETGTKTLTPGKEPYRAGNQGGDGVHNI
jgi:hypothetical protein